MVIVTLSVEVPPTTMVDGENTFVTVGGARKVIVSIAAFEVMVVDRKRAVALAMLVTEPAIKSAAVVV